MFADPYQMSFNSNEMFMNPDQISCFTPLKRENSQLKLEEYLICLRSNDRFKLDKIPELDKYQMIQYCLSEHRIDELIEIFNLDPEIDITIEDNSYFHSALQIGDPKLIDYLLGRGIIISEYLERQLTNLACYHIEILKLLTKYGLDLHLDDQYILKNALSVLNYDLCIYLMDNGANINQITNLLENFITSYHDTYYNSEKKNSFIKILKHLIDKGIDVLSNDNSAFKMFVSNGDYELTKLMIDSGADILSLKPIHLQSLINSRSIELIKLLVYHGVDFTILNSLKYETSTKSVSVEIYHFLQCIGVDNDVIIATLT